MPSREVSTRGDTATKVWIIANVKGKLVLGRLSSG